VRNHAEATLACDFFVTITATFRTLYVFVVLDGGTRQIVHWNVTEHPTAAWTVQQFRAESRILRPLGQSRERQTRYSDRGTDRRAENACENHEPQYVTASLKTETAGGESIDEIPPEDCLEGVAGRNRD
jgi:hypothetical protein